MMLSTAVIIVIGAALALLLIPLVIRLSHRYDLLDYPGQHKRHKQPTPFLGGPVLFVTVWICFLLYLVLFPSNIDEISRTFLYIFLGGAIIFMVGLSDDFKPISAWVKLLSQVAAGLVLYLGGLSINPLSVPFYGPVDLGVFSVFTTVFWVVALSNAINLIDGLDGLAAGVSLIAAVTLAIIGQFYGLGAVMVFDYALIGFLVVFMFFNSYPARIFMGDSGSLQIGYYFAVISLAVPIKSYTAAALYVPLLALGVPLLEIVVSFTRRLVAGRNIMGADRRHLFHYLSLAGLSQRWVVRIFYLLSIIFGLFALAMFFGNRLQVFGFLVLFMVVIFSTFFILLTNLTRFRHKHRKPE